MKPNPLVFDTKITGDLDVLDRNFVLCVAWNPRSRNGKSDEDHKKENCETQCFRLHRGCANDAMRREITRFFNKFPHSCKVNYVLISSRSGSLRFNFSGLKLNLSADFLGELAVVGGNDQRDTLFFIQFEEQILDFLTDAQVQRSSGFVGEH